MSGFGKKEDAESQDKMKMDEGHQDMEMTTSKRKENLKELSVHANWRSWTSSIPEPGKKGTSNCKSNSK